MNAGKITARFNIILHTDKPIPAMLGGIVNPLLQEYERAEKVDRKTVEKPLNFDPFGHAELSLFAKI